MSPKASQGQTTAASEEKEEEMGEEEQTEKVGKELISRLISTK